MKRSPDHIIFKLATTLLLTLLLQPMLGAQPQVGKPKIEFGSEAAVYLADKKLTIGEAIKLAITANYDLLSGAYELAKLDSHYKMYQKKYSPFLNAQATGDYQEFPQSTSVLTGTDQQSWGGSLGLSKYFPTGTQLTFGFAHDRTETGYLPISFSIPGLGTVSMPPFGDPSYHQPAVFLSLNQALLQNGFGHNEQREQRQIVNSALMQKDTILYQLSLVVIKVVMDYWNVVLKDSALDNATLQYEETKMVRDITQANVNLGKTNRFELNYYNVLLAAAKSQLLWARQEYKNAKRLFLQSINQQDTAILDGPAVLINQMPTLNEKEALAIAYQRRADYLGAKRMLENAKLEKEIAANLALPQLEVDLSINALGQQSELDRAYTELLEARQIGYSGKLVLTAPLGSDPVQEVKARNARYAQLQSEILIDKYQREIRDEINQHIEQIRTLFELYQTATQARQEAETFYQLMLGQLRRGRLNAATVKNGVDALAQSRQQELSALIQFNMANLQLLVTQNSLFDHYDINPDDYIPK